MGKKSSYGMSRTPPGVRSAAGRHPQGQSRGNKEQDRYGLATPRPDRLVRGGLGDKGGGPLPKRGR